ncbi:PAS domain S-box protein [Sediminibacter sp. Hel_I_10]|uniref:sensor histidine kinase n=1 Tax=Sediminibacter sp. Hel_I_10 TaxID=1392490 RepID=UPI00047E42F2|nr:HAMP domain-containing sensor histidine kinase [Sediminibacter sp. Hel_I_10]
MSEHLLKDKLFENIFDNANGGISIVNPSGKWLRVNQSIVDLLGYTKEELYGMAFQDITHRDDLDTDLNHFDQMLRGEIESYKIEKRYFHKNGSIVWSHLSVSMVKDDLNKPLYFIAQIIDITAEKETALKNQLLMDIVRDKNDKLNNFADIATHDLRTHVGNLGSITEFMADEFDGINDSENFKMWTESLKNLKDTLNHLDAIRYNHPFNKINLSAISLYECVNQTIYNVTAIARKNDVNIISNVESGLYVLAIDAYLDSIILNFLTNAIKYRSDDRMSYIEVNSRMEDDFVILDISDNGQGIDLNVNSNKLFTLNGNFGDHEDSRGIGLFITKKHIESIGGKIEVESKLGKGSCFSVYLKKYSA